MDIDFSIVLVSLVGVCGILWLFDSLLIRKTRLAAIEEYMSGQGKHKGDDEIADAVASLSREPLLIEYAKSFFPVLLIVLVLRSFLMEPFQIPTRP
jgi:signal peptidase I